MVLKKLHMSENIYSKQSLFCVQQLIKILLKKSAGLFKMLCWIMSYNSFSEFLIEYFLTIFWIYASNSHFWIYKNTLCVRHRISIANIICSETVSDISLNKKNI